MPNNYDFITPVYDFLSRLVYGKTLIRAQQDMMPFVPAGSRVLIAGGGTGHVLEALARLHPAGLQIWYVEQSGAMLRRARRRHCGGNEVHFIHAAIEAYSRDGRFDVIVTPFLFDNFRDEKAALIFRRLDAWLAAGGHWLFADFRYDPARSPYWQKLLLALMYRFFRLCCGIEASHLPQTGRLYEAYGYRELFRSSHFRGFIESVVYTRRPAATME